MRSLEPSAASLIYEHLCRSKVQTASTRRSAGVYYDLAEKGGYEAFALASHKFADDTLGVLVLSLLQSPRHITARARYVLRLLALSPTATASRALEIPTPGRKRLPRRAKTSASTALSNGALPMVWRSTADTFYSKLESNPQTGGGYRSLRPPA